MPEKFKKVWRCKDCKFFQPDPKDPNKGSCFGKEVDPEMDVRNCPTQSFHLKGENDLEKGSI